MIEYVDDHSGVPEKSQELTRYRDVVSSRMGEPTGHPLVSIFFSLLTAGRGAWPLRSLAASRP
jgi:hypothetical protein